MTIRCPHCQSDNPETMIFCAVCGNEIPSPQDGQGSWRNDPALKGKLHPEYPDDIQVIIHEGGRRFAKHPAEGIWVRVTGSKSGVYSGIILNTPVGLTNVRHGAAIKFVMPLVGEHPIMVTDKYLEERDHWVIHPCDKCGFAELYDAPSDFLRVAFPNKSQDEIQMWFSYKCVRCPNGFQLVENKDVPAVAKPSLSRLFKKKRWKFWK
jgi:DNA-directed RNA polymerase subunit RPC12/RpoP